MGRVIAISNQKGGVGKTTTAINLSACLAEKGKRTLVIDMDPQGNATSGLGIDKDKIDYTSYELLRDETTIWEAVTPTMIHGLTVIPADRDLAGAEIELIDTIGREFILKKEVDKVKLNYDFIIIDCPPSLNVLTVNAMTAADTILIPIQSEYYALEGLNDLMHTYELVKSRLNAKLEIEGIVFTMYDARTCLSIQVVDSVKENLHQKIYKTIIPRNVRLAEAPSHGLPINLYEPKSAGADAYRNLADEIINRKFD